MARCVTVSSIDDLMGSATLLLVLQMELVRERPQPPLLSTTIYHPEKAPALRCAVSVLRVHVHLFLLKEMTSESTCPPSVYV